MRKLRLYRGMAVLALLCLVPGAAAGGNASDYAFPIRNPYQATVLGTPAELRAPVPDRVPVRERSYVRFPEREIPAIFFQQTRFSYSIAAQRGPAPLIFVIAGTGARHDAGKMDFLQRTFWQAGFSVISLTSPTQLDFIVTGSSSSAPGYMDADVQDLYAIMQEIVGRHLELDVTGYYLTGYSLGATQSAFLARHDRSAHVFDFERVVLLCPSVNLFTSVRILDAMLLEAIPGGPRQFQEIIHGLLADVSDHMWQQGRSSLDVEFLYQAAHDGTLSDERLRALIAVVFRLALGDIVFVSDLMNGTGHVVAPERSLGISTSLTPYMKVSARWSFETYLDELLLPHWQERDATLSREKLIAAGDLGTIADFLRASEHVSMFTSADELILSGHDLEFLGDVFGSRGTIYPTGGHCGNLMYRENVADMLEALGMSGETGE